MADQSGQLETFFPYRLAVAAEGFSRSLSEVYGAENGLSREEWRLLFLLAGETEVTSTELARRTTLDKVQVSRASQRLADKGLITGQVAPQDRRLRVYRCTDAGRALFDALLPRVDARAKSILDQLPAEDRAALTRGLTALLAALGQAARN
ncbi:MarR family winged helix-turn-helix transcriptional regulator [Tropicibacter oceani]|uniref:MarR family transcriptional regulator n=1 Tax=Tropicibacter oceani TaxID=3058420 RepID=A0ABY8QNI7_9RHOB|nr:MarR family transcriptional regulator [Tropicibacter oceani]WGW06028.1 MarR family transcriptional regulator [Tropicibacter oceani]